MVIMKNYYQIAEVADMLNVSKDTLRRWEQSGKLHAVRHPMNNYRVYKAEDLKQFELLGFNQEVKFEANKEVSPKQRYTVMELFAGAGGRRRVR